jgi:hypothetical protein
LDRYYRCRYWRLYLCLRTNWDFSPDALGRYETNHLNNWAQVCLNLAYDNQGNKTFSIYSNCPNYEDCNGTPFGPAVIDCDGVCGGTTLRGDINADTYQNLGDAMQYVDEIISESISPTNCVDLNDDGEITVFDACLVQDCWYGEYDTTHVHGADLTLDHCNFPYGFTNTGDTVWLTVLSHDLAAKTIDLGMKNPYNTVLAYEFKMSGVEILTVNNLVPAGIYPISPENALGGDKVIGMSYQDSLIPKSFTYFPFARINYNTLTDTIVCISDIIEIVSGTYESVITVIDNACFTLPAITDSIVMNQIGNLSANGLVYEVCGSDDPYTLTANFQGGYFFGDGVIANQFHPNLVSPGPHELFYYYPNIMPVSIWVTVLNSTIIVLAEDSMNFMVNDPTFTFVDQPAGVLYEGEGVFGNTFNPSLAGIGTHEIIASYTLTNGCTDYQSIFITVDANVAIKDVNNELNVSFQPNPLSSEAILKFNNDEKANYKLSIVNALGQVVRTYTQVKDNFIIIEKGDLSNGFYTYFLEGVYSHNGKFIVE